MFTKIIAEKAKIVTGLILCSALATTPVAAQGQLDQGITQFDDKHISLAQAGVESLDSAVSRIRNQTGGRVLSAETRQEGNALVHYIRVLTKDGKVKRFRVVAKPK